MNKDLESGNINGCLLVKRFEAFGLKNMLVAEALWISVDPRG